MEYYRLEQLGHNDYRFVFASNDSEASRLAISYVWGEPPYTAYSLKTIYPSSERVREDQLIIRLSESFWHIDDFLDCLWNATQGHPFWLDQVSLPQNDKDLSVKLCSEIPMIYRKYPVRVLSNTTPCELIQSWNGVDDKDIQEIDIQSSSWRKHVFGCLNCGRLGGWFSRLWPRQEALYAKELRLIHNTLPPRNLSTYRQLHAVLLVDLQKNLSSMILDKIDHRTGIVDPHTGMWIHSDSQDMSNMKRMEMKFLRGDAITFTHQISFDDSIARLATSSKYVTKPRDLVLAVWCDLNGYKIPDEAKSMSLPDLMRDAFRQYTGITGRQIPILYLNRFAKAAGIQISAQDDDPLQPCYISPPEEPFNTLSCYTQWARSTRGIVLNDKKWNTNRMSGRVNENTVSFSSIQDFLVKYPSKSDFAALLKQQGNAHYVHDRQMLEAARLSPKGSETQKAYLSVLDIYSLIHYNKYFDSCLETSPDREKVSIDDVVIIGLLHLDIPIHQYTRHRSYVRFFPLQVWSPALIVDDTQEVCFMFPDGVNKTFLVKKVESSDNSDKGDWVVIGFSSVRSLERAWQESFEKGNENFRTIPAICR